VKYDGRESAQGDHAADRAGQAQSRPGEAASRTSGRKASPISPPQPTSSVACRQAPPRTSPKRSSRKSTAGPAPSSFGWHFAGRRRSAGAATWHRPAARRQRRPMPCITPSPSPATPTPTSETMLQDASFNDAPLRCELVKRGGRWANARWTSSNRGRRIEGGQGGGRIFAGSEKGPADPGAEDPDLSPKRA